jgi:hypothetical protein
MTTTSTDKLPPATGAPNAIVTAQKRTSSPSATGGTVGTGTVSNCSYFVPSFALNGGEHNLKRTFRRSVVK